MWREKWALKFYNVPDKYMIIGQWSFDTANSWELQDYKIAAGVLWRVYVAISFNLLHIRMYSSDHDNKHRKVC